MATAEKGWPINEDGDPVDGGNWQGSGRMDNPLEGIKADWYNATDNDTAWIIEGDDDILRSNSVFDYKYDLTIEDGGTLTLDCVIFSVNNTVDNHRIVIENGGTLYITNSSFTCWEIFVEQGGKLYILPGNESNSITFDSAGAPGIIISDGAVFELKNTTLFGESTLLTIEDDGAVVEGNDFSTTGSDEACILLKASAPINNNVFLEDAETGSYAIIAEEGVSSEIFENEFNGFKYGGTNSMGRAIMSYGPLEIYDNLFTMMKMNNAKSDPYIIYFIGVEPTDHDGNPVWETNRFRGINKEPNAHRVNIFKQAWYVDITVNNLNTGSPIDGADVEIKDNDDFAVDNQMTDENGQASFEIPEFYVSALNDGDTGNTTKTPHDLNPFDIEASKDGENDLLEDQTIDAYKQFTLQLDLVEFDFGVSYLDLPTVINAGDHIKFDATVFNVGYNRKTTVTVEYYITDGSRTETKLGETDVLVDLDFVQAYLNAQIPLSYANQDVTFRAETTYDDDYDANDAFTTDPVHINEKPKVNITAPTEGDTLTGLITITGTASDDVSVSEVQVNITGALDWTKANGTDSWKYELNSTILGLANGEYELNVRSRDSNGAFSDIIMIHINILNKPKIAITTPADGSLVMGNTTVTMVGWTQKLEAAIAEVTVTIDGVTVINATKESADWSQWKLPLKTIEEDNINSLSDGEHTFTATVTDEDGLTNTFSVKYIIYSMDESTDPTVTITTDPFNLTGDKWVEGTAVDDYRITDIQFKLNDGDWKTATEIIDPDTTSVTWRVRITPSNSDLVDHNNIVYIRAFDDDSNSTSLLSFTNPPEGLVDLFFGDVVLLNAEGNELKAGDLEVDKVITIIVTVKVEGNNVNLPQVAVRVTIGGADAGTKTEENVTGQFDITFLITLKESMKEKKTFSIIVDPANIIDENNDDGTAEQNNQYDGSLPGNDGIFIVSKDDGGSPGFEIVILIAGLAIASLLSLNRKRRD